MKLKDKVEKALNQQINSELNAGYTYLAMAAFFDNQELPGFASWFRTHAQEENGHAMKIYDFIVQRNGRVSLHGIGKPKTAYDSPEDAVATAMEMEETVSAQIYNLFELSHDTKEFGTQNMLHWFLDEQIKEEDLFRHLLEQVRAAGDSRWHLLTLDRQLSSGSVSA